MELWWSPLLLRRSQPPTLSSPRAPLPITQSCLSRMSHIQLTALGCVFSQDEDSPAEQSPGASPEKKNGLAQIAPDLTVIQFIKGR